MNIRDEILVLIYFKCPDQKWYQSTIQEHLEGEDGCEYEFDEVGVAIDEIIDAEYFGKKIVDVELMDIGYSTVEIIKQNNYTKKFIDDGGFERYDEELRKKNKVEKEYLKYIIGGVGIISVIYNIYSTERLNYKNDMIEELEDKIIQLNEEHKLFSDSIYSTHLYNKLDSL